MCMPRYGLRVRSSGLASHVMAKATIESPVEIQVGIRDIGFRHEDDGPRCEVMGRGRKC